jgi:hypothetical protein
VKCIEVGLEVEEDRVSGRHGFHFEQLAAAGAVELPEER